MQSQAEAVNLQCSTIEETQSVFNLFKRWQDSIKKTDDSIKCMCCHRRMSAKTPKFVMKIKSGNAPFSIDYEFTRLPNGFSDDPDTHFFHVHEKCLAQQLGFGDKIKVRKCEGIVNVPK